MLDLFVFGAGLSGLSTEIITNWVGPISLILIAAIAVKHLINQEIRKFFTFLALAGLVALVVYGTDFLFGSGGKVKELFKGAAEKIS